MGKVAKRYTTYNKIRLSLFIRSYAYHHIAQHVRRTYKINERLTSKELKSKYFSKSTIPEISKLARVLNLNYLLLWKSILLNQKRAVGKNLVNKEKVRIFLSIEEEIISLAIAKQNKFQFRDPDYKSELALLSIAVERAVGNALRDIEDDAIFEQSLAELKKKYTYLYYKTTCTYKLPTLRITPFILRLIS